MSVWNGPLLVPATGRGSPVVHSLPGVIHRSTLRTGSEFPPTCAVEADVGSDLRVREAGGTGVVVSRGQWSGRARLVGAGLVIIWTLVPLMTVLWIAPSTRDL